MITVAAAVLFKGAGAGSVTDGVRDAKGNDATSVGSNGTGSGTRCHNKSSGFLARRRPLA